MTKIEDENNWLKSIRVTECDLENLKIEIQTLF
jgi:hypothetical protein